MRGVWEWHKTGFLLILRFGWEMFVLRVGLVVLVLGFDFDLFVWSLFLFVLWFGISFVLFGDFGLF